MTVNANTAIETAVYNRNTRAPRAVPLDEWAARTVPVVIRFRPRARGSMSVAAAAREDIERRIPAPVWARASAKPVATLEPVRHSDAGARVRSHRLEA